jgi:type II secretory pathway pseudopilin PulG
MRESTKIESREKDFVMNSERTQRESARMRSADPGEDGYSLLQLLVVLSITIIMTGAAVFSLLPQRRAYGPDDAAGQVTNFLRDAYQRAISQRQTMKVQIDRSTMLIKIIDENTLPVGDEVEVRRAQLNNEISVNQPTVGGSALNPPASPYNYPVAAYSSNLWVARFRSDGSVVDASGNTLSATIFFSPVSLKTTDTNLIRAVTLYGPSGSIRFWRYTGSSFDAGAN